MRCVARVTSLVFLRSRWYRYLVSHRAKVIMFRTGHYRVDLSKVVKRGHPPTHTYMSVVSLPTYETTPYALCLLFIYFLCVVREIQCYNMLRACLVRRRQGSVSSSRPITYPRMTAGSDSLL